MKTRSLEGAVYNEVVDAWMIPQADPYTLANFQAAYDKLAAGRSTQTLSKSLAADFTPAKRLAPTHYALKIYPRNEEEQWQVEMMEDVQVAYIPFSFAQLTPDEAVKVEKSKTRSAANIFPEKSPYTVTYDYAESTDGDPTGPQTFQLPILYTVWPVSKPLPADLEYVLDYEIFLPHAASKTSKALGVLQNEAITHVLGRMVPIPIAAPNAATRASGDPVYPYDPDNIPPGYAAYPAFGKLVTRDNVLNTYVPLDNLEFGIRVGSNIQPMITDESGMCCTVVCLPTASTSHEDIVVSPLTITYNNTQYKTYNWKITDKTSLDPCTQEIPVIFKVVNVGDVYFDPYSLDLPLTEVLSGNLRLNEIHRAVNYYYNGQNDFEKRSPTGGTRIRAFDYNGRSYYTWGGAITIFNRGNDGLLIADVLHELGHLLHYGNPSICMNTHDFLRESFACYIAWYLTEEYYKSNGWVKPAYYTDITQLHGRQSWQKTHAPDDGWYSPFFIDMTDNYNQSTVNLNRPNDTIEGLPPSFIWFLLTEYPSIEEVLRISNATGALFSSDWLADFNEWYETDKNDGW